MATSYETIPYVTCGTNVSTAITTCDYTTGNNILYDNQLTGAIAVQETGYAKLKIQWHKIHTSTSECDSTWCDGIGNAYAKFGSKTYKVYSNGWRIDIAADDGWPWEAEAPSLPVELGGTLRSIIAKRKAPAIIIASHRMPIGHTTDIRELRARATLRKIVGDDQYRQLLRKGFISVQGPSGCIYNIRPGHAMTEVWKAGKMLKSLCIDIPYGFPPTDSLIMRAMMIWNQEEEFNGIANKRGPFARTQAYEQKLDQRPLIEILADVKKQYPGVPLLLPRPKQVA